MAFSSSVDGLLSSRNWGIGISKQECWFHFAEDRKGGGGGGGPIPLMKIE
jgi:hypothetical protein